MLLELAVADAYGAAFEGMPGPFVRRYNRLDGCQPVVTGRCGRYTDDTQMSLAIAEAIVAGDPWTPDALAERFVEVFKRDPRTGYAPGFYMFLRGVRDGQDFLECIRPHSTRSGAAMRAGPIGVLPTVDEVVEKATIQSRITHDTPDGIASSVAAALMAHYCIYELGPKADLGGFLEQHVTGNWSTPWEGRVSIEGRECVHAAVTAVVEHDGLSGILRACVDFTGDTDTVATIALAAASCSSEVEKDLPPVLIDGLEDGPYGRGYLVELDAQLLAVQRDLAG